MSSPQRKRIVIIGLGAMGSKHIDAVFRGSCFTIAALVDKNTSTWRDNLRCFISLTEALDGLKFDGAIVAASCDDHYSLVRQLLEQKIPVLVEKPFVLDRSDAESLMIYAYNTPLMVGHSERFNPAWIRTSEFVEQLGALKSIRSCRSLPTRRKTSDRDVSYDLMIHDLDLIFSMLGCEITALKCQGDEIQFKDCCSVTLTIGDVEVHCSADRAFERSERIINIEGEYGSIECDLLNRAVRLRLHNNLVHQAESVLSSDPLEEEHKAFSTLIDDGQSDHFALQCATEAVSVCQQVHTLLTTHSNVTLV
ncbi:MAG: Gfo/Idh/MocA family oxidoreductase [Fibrobacterales bacterium]